MWCSVRVGSYVGYETVFKAIVVSIGVVTEISLVDICMKLELHFHRISTQEISVTPSNIMYSYNITFWLPFFDRLRLSPNFLGLLQPPTPRLSAPPPPPLQPTAPSASGSLGLYQNQRAATEANTE